MNLNIGSGHVMRCLSIADAAKDMGIKSVFICSDDSGYGLIKSRGHEVKVLGTHYDDMESELDMILPFIEDEKPI